MLLQLMSFTSRLPNILLEIIYNNLSNLS